MTLVQHPRHTLTQLTSGTLAVFPRAPHAGEAAVQQAISNLHSAIAAGSPTKRAAPQPQQSCLPKAIHACISWLACSRQPLSAGAPPTAPLAPRQTSAAALHPPHAPRLPPSALALPHPLLCPWLLPPPPASPPPSSPPAAPSSVRNRTQEVLLLIHVTTSARRGMQADR